MEVRLCNKDEIPILIDFLKTYVLFDKFDSEEYRERKIQEEMEKLRK